MSENNETKTQDQLLIEILRGIERIETLLKNQQPIQPFFPYPGYPYERPSMKDWIQNYPETTTTDGTGEKT
jgi:hypothetical protein